MILQMYGEIVDDEWSWLYEFFKMPYCCPKQLRSALVGLPDGEELILEINSPGGSVWAGFEMYGVLRGCRRMTEAHIISMAASAATTVMIACDKVLASPVAQIMIHQPSAFVEDNFNNTAAAELLQFLDSVKASIINGYQLKCGEKTSRKKLEQLVDDSTWMPAQDAIALGLVDGLLDVNEEGQAALQISAGKALGLKNAVGCVSPSDLLLRYEEAVRNGAQPVEGHPVSDVSMPAEAPEDPQPAEAEPAGLGWQAAARIAIERERCFG